MFLMSAGVTESQSLIIMPRFVREGEEDRVADMIRTMADECKAEISRE